MNPFSVRAALLWLRRITLVAVVLGAATTAAVAPAFAGQTPSAGLRAPAQSAPAMEETVMLSASATVAHLGFGATDATVTKAATDSEITCQLKANNPHNSTHVPGTVNMVATIICTGPVSQLSINAGLYYNGSLIATGSKSNSGSATVQANAATSCVSGTYQGGATGSVVFPSGYEPPTSNFNGQQGWSTAVSIKC